MREWEKERDSRQATLREQNKLEEAGWHSTGKLPYVVAQDIRKSAGSVTVLMYSFLNKKLKNGELAYGDENLKKVGRKVYLSPALAVETEEHIKRSYNLMSEQA